MDASFMVKNSTEVIFKKWMMIPTRIHSKMQQRTATPLCRDGKFNRIPVRVTLAEEVTAERKLPQTNPHVHDRPEQDGTLAAAPGPQRREVGLQRCHPYWGSAAPRPAGTRVS